MNYPWLDDYCTNKPGAARDFKVEWDAVRFQVGDKMFAMLGGDKEGKPIATFKLAPENCTVLREQYSDIVPGYYMNKQHWVSLCLSGTVPEEVVRRMADEAYNLIVAALPKTKRVQILGE